MVMSSVPMKRSVLDPECAELLRQCKVYVKTMQTSDEGILFVDLSQQEFLKGKPYQRWAKKLKQFLLMDEGENGYFQFSHHRVAVVKQLGPKLETDSKKLYEGLEATKKPKKNPEVKKTTKKNPETKDSGKNNFETEKGKPKKKLNGRLSARKAKGCGWIFMLTKLQLFFAFTEIADIATDFAFWFNISSDKDLQSVRLCVLIFTFIGLALQVPKWLNTRACLQAGMHKWQYQEREAVMGFIIALLEDFPQIILACLVTAEQGWTDLAQLTIGFSFLSVIGKFSLPVFMHFNMIIAKPNNYKDESFCQFISRIVINCATYPHPTPSKADMVCWYFEAGNCMNGEKCEYLHPKDVESPSLTKLSQKKQYEKQSEKPFIPKTKHTKPLSEDEYAQLEQRRKVDCSHFQKTGKCSHAQFCFFKHDGAASHRPPSIPVCQFFFKPVGCRFEENCRGRHYLLPAEARKIFKDAYKPPIKKQSPKSIQTV